MPIWLANMELFMEGIPLGEDPNSELATLIYFADYGMRWLDRTRIVGNPEARRWLGRALRHYLRFADFRDIVDETAAKAFVVRGCHLLRSLR